MYNEIKGDLIVLAKEGMFDVIAHGCNSFCTMGAGIAPQMAKAFGVDKLPLEHKNYVGDYNKLGQIEYKEYFIGGKQDPRDNKVIAIVNAYTQYDYSHKNGAPVDYDAITLCMRKMNHVFKGKHIGLPAIGGGLAGGDWNRIKIIIQTELKDCDVTVVIYDKNKK
jgi:O-acetyl-ADP-ribose deacetylase (regulator of RNase III)